VSGREIDKKRVLGADTTRKNKHLKHALKTWHGCVLVHASYDGEWEACAGAGLSSQHNYCTITLHYYTRHLRITLMRDTCPSRVLPASRTKTLVCCRMRTTRDIHEPCECHACIYIWFMTWIHNRRRKCAYQY
jgi:hypothetical protein